MKKTVAYLLCFVAAGMLLTGCGEKKTEELEYANLTVEQNKTKIQDEGLAVMNKLSDMSNLSGLFAMKDLDNLLNNSTLTGDPMEAAVKQLISPILQLEKNTLSVTKLRSTVVNIETISSIMNQVGGVYTYNRLDKTFNRVANTSKIELLFPVGTSSTNNGKLTISNLKAQAGAQGIEEVPTSLDITLTKGTATLMSFGFTASYDANMVPTAWNTTLTFAEGYKFTQAMTNTTTDMAWQFAYALDNENLLSGKFSSKGNFSYDALNNSTDLTEEEMMDLILDNANSYVQLGNLKLTGVVDVNKFMDAYKAAFPAEPTQSKADMDKVSQMLNANVSLVLMYAKEGTVIAKSNFYTEEYSDYEINFDTYQWELVTIYQPSMQLLFKDGSAMDDSFFAQGFEDLQLAFQEMIMALQTSYAQ